MRNTLKNFMLILALCLFTSLTGTSQDTVPKPTQGWAVGLAPTYTNQQGTSNLGLQAVATTAITPLWGWRATATVNGLVAYHRDAAESFDRYAAALTGPVVNLGPLYAFAQAGAALNPSTRCKVGIAANAGAGLQFDIGPRSRLFAEALVETAQADSRWLQTFAAAVGYTYKINRQ